MPVVREKFHKMQRDNVCAVAALRTVLHLQYDVNIAEAVLEALGTDAHDPIRVYGTDTRQLRRMLREANRAFNTGKLWRLRIRRYGDWAILFEATQRQKYPIARVRLPLNEYRYDPGATELHAVVVYEVDAAGDELKVFDPATGRLHRVRWDEFREWWTDADGIRWMATVSP